MGGVGRRDRWEGWGRGTGGRRGEEGQVGGVGRDRWEERGGGAGWRGGEEGQVGGEGRRDRWREAGHKTFRANSSGKGIRNKDETPKKWSQRHICVPPPTSAHGHEVEQLDQDVPIGQ